MREENARALIAAVLVVALTAGGPIEAAYLQAGYDAARTGNSPDAGPTLPEVAWRVKLPGSRAPWTPPLISDGKVYVALYNGTDPYRHPSGAYASGLDTNATYAIDIDSGREEPFVPLASGAFGMASDGRRLYVATLSHGIQAHDIVSRAVVWKWPYPQASLDGSSLATRCEQLALSGGTLFAACNQRTGRVTDPDPDARPLAFVVALDVNSKEEKWIAYKGQGENGFPAGGPEDPVKNVSTAPIDFLQEFSGLTLVPPHLFLTVKEAELRADPGWERRIFALRQIDGKQLWQMNASTPDLTPAEVAALALRDVPPLPAVTGSRGTVFARLNETVLMLNPGTREVLWSYVVGREDTLKDDLGAGFAYDGDVLYAASAQTVYKLNTTTKSSEWLWRLPVDSRERWGPAGFVIADNVVYGSTETRAAGTIFTLRAARTQDGKELFSYETRDGIDTSDVNSGELHFIHFLFGLGDRVLAIAGIDGTVTLLGRTSASIRPVVNASSMYPAPGEALNVTLEDTLPGLQGKATEFRADWSDGDATDGRNRKDSATRT